MATLNITFGANLPLAAAGAAQALQLPALDVENLTVSGTSAQSVAAPEGTTFVRLVSDADTWIVVGLNPTATVAEGVRLLAESPEYFGVPAGYKIAGITA